MFAGNVDADGDLMVYGVFFLGRNFVSSLICTAMRIAVARKRLQVPRVGYRVSTASVIGLYVRRVIYYVFLHNSLLRCDYIIIVLFGMSRRSMPYQRIVNSAQH